MSLAMRSIIQRFRHWVSDDPVVYECRNCGTTVDKSHDSCPACDAADIACYELT